MRFATALVLSALPLMPLPALAQEAPARTISLQGTGTVSTAPDMATITSGVVTQAKTAREALDQNNKAMAGLIDVIKSAGIEDRDIQTSGFRVEPQYVYSDKRDQNGYSKPPEIVGYQVYNNVTVKVRQLDALGGVLDQMVTAGSNSINGISFGVNDPAETLDAARKSAIEDARHKAELYAGALGLTLGPVLSVSENGGNIPQPFAAKTMAMDVRAESVPVQAGEMDYSVNVSVSWEIEAKAGGN